MSVLDFLFPDEAGLRNTGRRAHPVGGEYVIDVDDFLFRGITGHEHPRTWVCNACLEAARRYAVVLSELVEENYSNVAIVFSGSRGFHVHVLDFGARDWVSQGEQDPFKVQEAARRRYTLHLSRRLDTCFNGRCFTFFNDATRVVPVPQTLNASTGLVCRPIGSRRDLEVRSVTRILDEANPALTIWPVTILMEHYTGCSNHGIAGEL
jgi:hypothetical protein